MVFWIFPFLPGWLWFIFFFIIIYIVIWNRLTVRDITWWVTCPHTQWSAKSHSYKWQLVTWIMELSFFTVRGGQNPEDQMSAQLAKSLIRVTGCHLHECYLALHWMYQQGTHPSNMPDCYDYTCIHLFNWQYFICCATQCTHSHQKKHETICFCKATELLCIYKGIQLITTK